MGRRDPRGGKQPKHRGGPSIDGGFRESSHRGRMQVSVLGDRRRKPVLPETRLRDESGLLQEILGKCRATPALDGKRDLMSGIGGETLKQFLAERSDKRLQATRQARALNASVRPHETTHENDSRCVVNGADAVKLWRFSPAALRRAAHCCRSASAI